MITSTFEVNLFQQTISSDLGTDWELNLVIMEHVVAVQSTINRTS